VVTTGDDGAAVQPPASGGLGCAAQGDDLGDGGGVATGGAVVPADAQQRAVVVEDQHADGRIVLVERIGVGVGHVDGLTHPRFVLAGGDPAAHLT
jgi:hypothetical protein